MPMVAILEFSSLKSSKIERYEREDEGYRGERKREKQVSGKCLNCGGSKLKFQEILKII